MSRLLNFTIITVLVAFVMTCDDAIAASPGDLDTSFGTGGIVKVDIDSNTATLDWGTGVATDGNGKIVVCARADNGGPDSNFAVLRFNSNGTLDTSFDGDSGSGNGIVITDINGNTAKDWANAIAINKNAGVHNGKIVVAGTTLQDNVDSNAAVVVYNTDGTIDQQRFIDFSPAVGDTQDEIYGVAIQADNKIVIAGRTDSDFFLARLEPVNLNLDTTFDTDGMATATFSAGADVARAVAIQPHDQKIIAVGIDGTNGDFALLRLMPTGLPDTDFDTDGKMTVSFGTSDGGAFAVDIDQTPAVDRIVVAGVADTGSGTTAFAVTRHIMATGVLDTSFDTDGKATISFSAKQDMARGIKTQADGKYVIAGVADAPGASENFGLARLSSDGSVDTSFGTNGVVTTDTSGNNTTDASWAVDLSSIIAVGVEFQTDSVVIAKYRDQESKFSWPTFLPAIIKKK